VSYRAFLAGAGERGTFTQPAQIALERVQSALPSPHKAALRSRTARAVDGKPAKPTAVR
jgi:hypothetical protein